MLPCLIFEDEHLLVVNKPSGLNTHAPSPYAGEGIYDWLRHREPRWAKLAIIHRLDKETSGVLVFTKTPMANRSLTRQFTARSVHKKYLLLTDRPVGWKEVTVKGALVRVGERYVSRPMHAGGELAETHFIACTSQRPEAKDDGCCQMIEAKPLTGRTHQIRVHAAEKGFPILGDTLYGGTPAARVYLHAAELTLKHPASDEQLTFRAPTGPDWADIKPPDPANARGVPYRRISPLPILALRAALIEPERTSTYRIIHGGSDARPGWYVDRLGDYLLSQSEAALNSAQREELGRLAKVSTSRGAYHKLLKRRLGSAARAEVSPQLVLGLAAPERFTVQESGISFELSFAEGYSVGLFLDQRDNRRRLLIRHIASDFPLLQSAIGDRQWELLNAFAYTCGFSVCAAQAGARTTSLDLSKRWLDWGKGNFALNRLDAAGHEFIYGEVFDWLRRLAKKERCYDVIALDPPTFSQSKESGVFRAEKDYGRLVAAALPLLRSGGVLFVSTNAADWLPDEFLAEVDRAIHQAKRRVLQLHYVPQPPDFPISRAEPAYLKTAWLRIE
ncbi:MAG: pseudouridine synthase [Verrucomicrobia bacterium]|nr:pseudouridine synthase [Verrucomicrobiota bacterium]